MTAQKGRMPVLFVGHGSPMNAVEENQFTKNWAATAAWIPKPKAILAISAHWYTDGSRINDETHPEMVYDMYGFPDELYRIKYPVNGSPELAQTTRELISRDIRTDNSWGIDHGTWSVLCKMYPAADIPVVQLSLDRNADAETHFRIGQQLGALRDEGVLLLGSGNVVHNLAKIDWEMQGGFPWAVAFDGYIQEQVNAGRHENVIHYQSAGESAREAFYTPEHFDPLLYTLGATATDDRLSIFNDACVMGSLAMTCYLWE